MSTKNAFDFYLKLLLATFPDKDFVSRHSNQLIFRS